MISQEKTSGQIKDDTLWNSLSLDWGLSLSNTNSGDLITEFRVLLHEKGLLSPQVGDLPSVYHSSKDPTTQRLDFTLNLLDPSIVGCHPSIQENQRVSRSNSNGSRGSSRRVFHVRF